MNPRRTVRSSTEAQASGPRRTFFHPEWGRTIHMESVARPEDDEEATELTISRMARYAAEDAQESAVREAAFEAIHGLPVRDARKEIAAVFAWIKHRLQFRQDAELAGLAQIENPDAAEVLIRPVDLLRMRQPSGDCDDYAMLTASMLRALGIRGRFVTIAADRDDPSRYSHVYTEAVLPGGEIIALDTSHGPRPGWAAPAVGKRRTWSIDQMNNLGAIDWGQLVKIGAETGSQIATARYGQPPAGTYIQDGNKILFRQPDNAGSFTFPTTQIGGAGGSAVLIGGALLIGLIVVVSALKR